MNGCFYCLTFFEIAAVLSIYFFPICSAAEKRNDSTFLSVTELSSGGQNLSRLGTVDMVILV